MPVLQITSVVFFLESNVFVTNSTLLIIACEMGDLKMAELLLDNNANIDGRGFKER